MNFGVQTKRRRKTPFENSFKENIPEQIKVNNQFQKSYQKRQTYIEEFQSDAIPSVDPLSFIVLDNK